jgi:hypothetical protein
MRHDGGMPGRVTFHVTTFLFFFDMYIFFRGGGRVADLEVMGDDDGAGNGRLRSWCIGRC